MKDTPIKDNLIASMATISFAVLLGLILISLLNHFLDQWCLYEPIYLMYKAPDHYMVMFFVTNFLLTFLIKPKARVLLKYKRTIRTTLFAIMIGSVVAYFYFAWSYGGPGAGACSDPNLNRDYLKYPGQEMYHK